MILINDLGNDLSNNFLRKNQSEICIYPIYVFYNAHHIDNI